MANKASDRIDQVLNYMIETRIAEAEFLREVRLAASEGRDIDMSVFDTAIQSNLDDIRKRVQE